MEVLSCRSFAARLMEPDRVRLVALLDVYLCPHFVGSRCSTLDTGSPRMLIVELPGVRFIVLFFLSHDMRKPVFGSFRSRQT